MKEKIQLLITENTRYLLNLSTTYLSQLISAVTVLVITPILLTRLGNKDFSMYGLVLNAVFLAGVFDCGLNMGLLKKLIADKQNQNRLISTVFYFFIGLSLLGLPISYFLLNRLWNTNGFYGFITVILILQTILILFFDVMLQSVNKIYLGRAIRIIKLLLEFIILFLLSSFASVYWLLVASILLNLLYIGALFYHAKKEVSFKISFHDFSSALLMQHFAYSWWYFMSAVTVVLVFNAQLMMMGWVASAEAIAKFLVVGRFFDIIRIGISNFTLILFPTLAAIQHEGDWHKIKALFKKILLRVSIIALFVLLFAALAVKPFFLIWSKFSDPEMVNLFLLYCIFIFLIAVDNVSSTFLSALKINSVSVAISFFQGCIGLILGYYLFQNIGLIGILIGSIIALLITNFWINPYILYKKINRELQILQ